MYNLFNYAIPCCLKTHQIAQQIIQICLWLLTFRVSTALVKLSWMVVPGRPQLLSVCPPLSHWQCRAFQWQRWNTWEEDTEKLMEGTKCFHNETDIPPSLLSTCNPISLEWAVLNIAIRSLFLQNTSMIFLTNNWIWFSIRAFI